MNDTEETSGQMNIEDCTIIQINVRKKFGVKNENRFNNLNKFYKEEKSNNNNLN